MRRSTPLHLLILRAFRTRSAGWFARGGRARPVAAMLLAGLAIVAAVAIGKLPGSTFEGNDGNLMVDTAGNTDWVNAPNRTVAFDLESGADDNSFGQGTKEDDPNTSVVDGSIPPKKNDLPRFLLASESPNGDNFLYLAWERRVNIGSANLDLEINKNSTAGFNQSTQGPVTLNRSPGDLLVSYDFGGSGEPKLALLTWITAANGKAADCYSANTLPCWGRRVDLSGISEGAVNTGTITAPILPPAARQQLTEALFGEAAINLTKAGVFPPGTCKALGSAFLKSSSSASFPAAAQPGPSCPRPRPPPPAPAGRTARRRASR